MGGGFCGDFGSVVASGAENSWVEKERDREREENFFKNE